MRWLAAGIEAKTERRAVVQQLGTTLKMDVTPFETLLDIREDKSGAEIGRSGRAVCAVSGVHSQIGRVRGPVWRNKIMKVALIVLGVVVLLALMLGGSLMSARNELVTEREAIKGAWSQVDVALQRRADLIPNLVETVKGFAKHEANRDRLSDQCARGDDGRARRRRRRSQANSQLDSALGRLFVVVENYPNIKANENFLRLQDELAGTENRIAVERRKYNEVGAEVQHRYRAVPQEHRRVACSDSSARTPISRRIRRRRKLRR